MRWSFGIAHYTEPILARISALVLSLWVGCAAAFPDKPVRFVVGFTPAGRATSSRGSSATTARARFPAGPRSSGNPARAPTSKLLLRQELVRVVDRDVVDGLRQA